MPRLFPFKGIIPAKDKLEKVVSKPFEKYTRQEIEQIISENPLSFLNIIKPELSAGIKSTSAQDEPLLKSRLKFEEFVEKGILQKADSSRFYLYRQTKPDFVYTGLIASISAADYSNGTIKIHEQTLSRKEEKLKDYLKIVGINAEPVMFTYPHQQEIDQYINQLCAEKPYIEFSFDDKKHSFWELSEPKTIEKLEQAFSAIEHVYVADGHHRSASSALLAEELASKNGTSNDEPSSRFLGIFFPDHNLQLLEFNRLLKDTNSLSEQEILEKLAVDFTVELIQGVYFKPRMLHEISMYLAGHWYSLKFRFDRMNEQLTEKLDANILSQTILNQIFGIKDLRVDSRVDFLNGLHDPSQLKKLVDSGKFAAAFGLYPVSFEQFFAFSDAGYMMPPKTTWFEPKLLNGLVIYDLEL
jgi:uncharacterized protein (DUF1015 family)